MERLIVSRTISPRVQVWFQEPSLLFLSDAANSEFSLRNLKLKEHVTLLNLKKDIQSKEVDLRVSDIEKFSSLD